MTVGAGGRDLGRAQTLSNQGGRRSDNSFDLVRLSAATLVLVGHAWPLSGLKGVPQLGGTSIHHLGVFIFFVLSGYLLTLSWNRKVTVGRFLIRRCFRIFPALFVVVLLTVFVIGPVLSSLSASEYFSDSKTWAYLSGLALMPQYLLPGVFVDNPTSAVNGSLWSLGPEFICYVVLALLGFLVPRLRVTMKAVILISLLAATSWLEMPGYQVTTLLAFAHFAAGSLLADLKRTSVLNGWVAIAGLAVLALLGGLATHWLSLLVVAYATISLGLRSTKVAHALRKLGDPSYGMYLWGFLVQQTLVQVSPQIPPMLSLLLAACVSTAIGYASWHVLEKRAIQLGYSRVSRAS